MIEIREMTVKAPDLLPGDVVLGAPAGPYRIKRVTNGSLAGSLRINVLSPDVARQVVRPEREFRIQREVQSGQ